MMFLRVCTVASLLVAWNATAQGAILAQYNLDNALDNITQGPAVAQSDAVDLVAAGVSASNIVATTNGDLGWGNDDAITPNVDVNGPSSDGHTWWSRGTTLPNSSVNTATDPYIGFSVTTGGAFDFSSGTLDITYALHDRNKPGAYQSYVELYLDEGGSLTLLDTLDLDAVDNNQRNFSYNTASLDLSSLSGLLSSANFRLYFFDNSSDGEKHTILDTIALTGQVVPEPATWTLLLLGFAGLGWVGWRRRRAA